MNAHPDKTFVLMNPDLEMKGSPVGIRERDRRQAVLDSFKSAYIYLCLVRAPTFHPTHPPPPHTNHQPPTSTTTTTITINRPR